MKGKCKALVTGEFSTNWEYSLSALPILIHPKPLKKDAATSNSLPFSPRRSSYDTTSLFVSRLPSSDNNGVILTPKTRPAKMALCS